MSKDAVSQLELLAAALERRGLSVEVLDEVQWRPRLRVRHPDSLASSSDIRVRQLKASGWEFLRESGEVIGPVHRLGVVADKIAMLLRPGGMR